MNTAKTSSFYGQLSAQSDKPDFGKPYRSRWHRLKSIDRFNGNKRKFDSIRTRRVASPPLG
jgi:hypothetical protein